VGKAELVRIALAGGQQASAGAPRMAVLDRDGRLAGRGAYLCRREGLAQARPECLEQALQRRAFARTLRAKVTVDPKLVESIGR
jgi:predicted RNA-binding protein YlxR (DUF448 family)